MNEVIYINKCYLKNSNSNENMYIRIDFPDEILSKIWKDYNWELAEKTIFEWQCVLSKLAFSKKIKEIKELQDKITGSVEARMLAVKKVSEELKSSPGIDGVKWKSNSDKMRAAISLTSKGYKAKPFREYAFQDKKSGKKRYVGIPTLYDRAMHIVYFYALEPIAEAWADRRSYAFRKDRSALQAHAKLCNVLRDNETGDWVLIADVKSYYSSISHEWLLNNIPMNKKVLKEFIEAGFIFDGEEIFPESGISLGCSISPTLGNMTLDGIQKLLYSLQGDKIKEFKNGWSLRFADDIVILAKTREDAERFKNALNNFLSERGLKFSEEKTKIININSGFEFLSRFYYKSSGVLHCVPTEQAVKNFEISLEELILKHETSWTQKGLIIALNRKLNGWASYHRVCEAKDVFKHIDIVVNALLLKYMILKNPKLSHKQLINKYWYKSSDNRFFFAIPNNRDVKVVSLEDVILIEAQNIDDKQNYFLDKEYFDKLNSNLEIRNVNGRFKEVWERQEGKCAICNKKIEIYQDRVMISTKLTKRRFFNNLLYIHKKCEENELVYIKLENHSLDNKSVEDLVDDINKIIKSSTKKRVSKFDRLRTYFHNSKKSNITLKFSDIEKIIGSKLCSSAYKHQSYFYNHSDERSIANCWLSQGFKILNLDLENNIIIFSKDIKNKPRIILPDFLFSKSVPKEAKYEIENFFEYVKDKYKL